ncbi:MAG: DNA-3-methyladenine glycosylase family protein [Verrucomicrobiales bacterium]|jgi:DNA-3-methyladenine glycosylase II
MRRVHEVTGNPPLRRNEPGFEGLARIIVGQQLSVASARAIWERALATAKPFTAQRLLKLDEATLRSPGLSRPKIKTLRAIAESVDGRELNLARLAELSDDDIHTQLTAISGIGPWTADIYIMLCLGRANAWASGDLALQVAIQELLDLAERPSAQETAKFAEAWRPWRAVAAGLLWAYYAAVRLPKSGTPP